MRRTCSTGARARRRGAAALHQNESGTRPSSSSVRAAGSLTVCAGLYHGILLMRRASRLAARRRCHQPSSRRVSTCVTIRARSGCATIRMMPPAIVADHAEVAELREVDRCHRCRPCLLSTFLCAGWFENRERCPDGRRNDRCEIAIESQRHRRVTIVFGVASIDDDIRNTALGGE